MFIQGATFIREVRVHFDPRQAIAELRTFQF